MDCLRRHCLALLVVFLIPIGVQAQERPDPQALQSAQRAAMATFAFMDGVWRGKATITLPGGEKREIDQTERIGPFLDGTLKVLEGRGFEPDGKMHFNAFGIISYNPGTKAYTMRSYAQGLVGDFAVVRTADGFSWEIPAGPMTIRYVTVVKDGTWTEVGERLAPGRPAVKFFEMTLTRTGDTDWPAAGALGPR